MSKPQRRLSAKQEAKRLQKKIETELKTKWKLAKKKPLWVSLRKHIGMILDNAKPHEIAKLVAILGMTIIVKQVIDSSETLMGELDLIKRGKAMAPGLPGFGFGLALSLGYKIHGVPTPEYEGLFPDWMDWLISFTLAYIIVENFGEIMHAAGNVTSSIKTILLGLMAGGGVAT
jgi:hypothetical protein